MTDDPDTPPRGRLFVVVGTELADRSTLAVALARRFERAVAVDGETFDCMLVAGREPYAEPPTGEQLRQLLLRWSAAIATAETYLLEGFDAVLSDDVHGERLEEFLDLAAPEPVHLVVLADAGDRETPRWGLWVDAARAVDPAADTGIEATVDEILRRLDESVVLTAEPDSPLDADRSGD